MILDFFRRKGKAAKQVKAQTSTSRYKLVSLPDEQNRERTFPEHESEDEILDPYARGKIINSARQGIRNSGILNSLIKTMTLNVCGTEAGKVVLPFEADGVLREFSKWTRSCDFVDNSITLNEITRLALITKLLNGDLVLLHDNGLITDSGRLLTFEGDSIVSTSEEAIITHYGSGARQSQGRVYDSYGRFCGIVVSNSQRSVECADPDSCFFLRCDPDASPLENDWFYVANRWRPNQGRGVSPLASTLRGIEDAEMLKNFELQSSKRNAQLLLQVLQEPQKEDETTLPSTLGDDVDIDSMSEDEIRALVAKEVPQRIVTLDKLNSANAQTQIMEAGVRAEVLDSKRPNPNVQSFLDYLTQRSFTPFGLSEQFALANVSGADYKANQLFSERAFRQEQKGLEQMLDWVFTRWHSWAVAHGKINALTEEQIASISWTWPKQSELDEGAMASAQRQQLENLTISYQDILGNDYKSKLAKIRDEVLWMKEAGLVHPAYKLLSGGESKLLDVDTQA